MLRCRAAEGSPVAQSRQCGAALPMAESRFAVGQGEELLCCAPQCRKSHINQGKPDGRDGVGFVGILSSQVLMQCAQGSCFWCKVLVLSWEPPSQQRVDSSTAHCMELARGWGEGTESTEQGWSLWLKGARRKAKDGGPREIYCKDLTLRS